jgi:hypothetical protein
MFKVLLNYFHATRNYVFLKSHRTHFYLHPNYLFFNFMQNSALLETCFLLVPLFGLTFDPQDVSKSSSETCVQFSRTTCSYNRKYNTFCNHRCENFRSKFIKLLSVANGQLLSTVSNETFKNCSSLLLPQTHSFCLNCHF